jgi:hypothetical protein
VHLKETTKCEVDTGYQGIQKRHSNTDMPKKKTKKKPLTKEEKKKPKNFSKQSID